MDNLPSKEEAKLPSVEKVQSETFIRCKDILARIHFKMGDTIPTRISDEQTMIDTCNILQAYASGKIVVAASEQEIKTELRKTSLTEYQIKCIASALIGHIPAPNVVDLVNFCGNAYSADDVKRLLEENALFALQDKNILKGTSRLIRPCNRCQKCFTAHCTSIFTVWRTAIVN